MEDATPAAYQHFSATSRNPEIPTTRSLDHALVTQFSRMRQECVEVRLGVPGMCHGEAGFGVGKRYKWLIVRPLEPPTAD
jgi:hypothetical protein